jgi:NADH:ubiquinone oxidoreductase subunit 4 (subunit M)
VNATVNATDLKWIEKAPAILLALALLVVGIFPRILLQLLP